MVIDPSREKKIMFSLEAENIEEDMEVELCLGIGKIGVTVPMEVKDTTVTGTIPVLKGLKNFLTDKINMRVHAYVGEKFYIPFESEVTVEPVKEAKLKMILLED